LGTIGPRFERLESVVAGVTQKNWTGEAMAGVVLVTEADVMLQGNIGPKSLTYSPALQNLARESPIIIDLDVHNLWD